MQLRTDLQYQGKSLVRFSNCAHCRGVRAFAFPLALRHDVQQRLQWRTRQLDRAVESYVRALGALARTKLEPYVTHKGRTLLWHLS